MIRSIILIIRTLEAARRGQQASGQTPGPMSGQSFPLDGQTRVKEWRKPVTEWHQLIQVVIHGRQSLLVWGDPFEKFGYRQPKPSQSSKQSSRAHFSLKAIQERHLNASTHSRKSGVCSLKIVLAKLATRQQLAQARTQPFLRSRPIGIHNGYDVIGTRTAQERPMTRLFKLELQFGTFSRHHGRPVRRVRKFRSSSWSAVTGHGLCQWRRVWRLCARSAYSGFTHRTEPAPAYTHGGQGTGRRS